jgi:hypothetical protein
MQEAQHQMAARPGSLPTLNDNFAGEFSQGLAGGESSQNPFGDNNRKSSTFVCSPGNTYTFDIPDTSHPTHLDGSTDASHRADVSDSTDTEDATNTVDLTDAELYDQITHLINPEEGHVPSLARPQSTEPHIPAPTPPILGTGGDSDWCPHSDLEVVHFLHGSAGAPVPGAHQGQSLYDASQEALGSSPWAPFRSQCDWEIAHWAKMCGPTSSALTDFLAIPEVRVPLVLFTVLLMCYERS